MKKLYASVLSLFALSAVNAQSITSSNIPVVGDVNDYYAVDTATISGAGSAGTGQTYNFTSVVVNPTMLTRSYMDPDSTPYASDFSSSQVALLDEGQYSFYSGTTNYQMDGMVISMSGITGTVILSDKGIIFPSFPFDYNSALHYDTLNGTITSSMGGGTIDGGITTDVDGSGTLNLPGISFNNVIRVKMITNTHASLLGGSFEITQKEIRYMFFSSTSKFPVFEYGTLQMDSNAPTEFATISSAAYVGVKENQQADFGLYPNPAKNELFVRMDAKSESYTVEIINGMGQTVKAETLSKNNGLARVSLDGISSGIYFVRVGSGAASSVQKLIVE